MIKFFLYALTVYFFTACNEGNVNLTQEQMNQVSVTTVSVSFNDSAYELLKLEFPTEILNFYNVQIPWTSTTIYIKALKKPNSLGQFKLSQMYNLGQNSELNEYNYLKYTTKLKQLKLIEGELLSDSNLNNPLVGIDGSPLKVSLLFDSSNHRFYGISQWKDSKVLLFYGNKIQLVDIDRPKSDLLNYSAISVKNYQAVFSEDYNSDQGGYGLEIILGSYLAQKHIYSYLFNLNLQLTALTYLGTQPDAFALEAIDGKGYSQQDAQRLYIDALNTYSTNLADYSSSAFVVWYRSNKLSHVLGPLVGQSFIDVSCRDEYKTLWVTAFSLEGRSGQYIVDAHEIAHNLAAEHTDSLAIASSQFPLGGDVQQFLMNPRVHPVSTQLRFGRYNSQGIVNSKALSDQNGECLLINARNKSAGNRPRLSQDH